MNLRESEREMEDYLKQLAETATTDQGLAATRNLARQLWVYYEEASRAGFTIDQAFALTVDLQRGMLALQKRQEGSGRFRADGNDTVFFRQMRHREMDSAQGFLQELAEVAGF